MSAFPQDFEPIAELETGKTTKRWYEYFADNDAYTLYTPTVTAQAGTFTTVAGAIRYKKRGRFVFINVTVTITTNGTAATSVLVTLPVAPTTASNQILSGRNYTAGTVIAGLISGTSSAQILRYDATYPGANATVLVLTGVYEAAS